MRRVRKFGRGLFLVPSYSREELDFFVDFEGFEKYPTFCDCEAFRYHGHRPCKHIRRAFPKYIEGFDLDKRLVRVIKKEFDLCGDALEAVLRGVKIFSEKHPPNTPKKRSYKLKSRSYEARPSNPN